MSFLTPLGICIRPAMSLKTVAVRGKFCTLEVPTPQSRAQEIGFSLTASATRTPARILGLTGQTEAHKTSGRSKARQEAGCAIPSLRGWRQQTRSQDNAVAGRQVSNRVAGAGATGMTAHTAGQQDGFSLGCLYGVLWGIIPCGLALIWFCNPPKMSVICSISL